MATPKDSDSLLERRVSLRLQYSQQKPFYGTRKRTQQQPEAAGRNGVVLSKKAKVKLSSPAKKSEIKTRKLGRHKVDFDEAGNCESEELENAKVESEEDKDCEGENKSVSVKERDMSVYAPSGARIDDQGKSYVAKLKETLRRFNLHYLHFVQVNNALISTAYALIVSTLDTFRKLFRLKFCWKCLLLGEEMPVKFLFCCFMNFKTQFVPCLFNFVLWIQH